MDNKIKIQFCGSIMSKNNILHGPELVVPVPEISIGTRMYNCFMEASPQEVLFIDGKTGDKMTYKEFLHLSCRLARALQNSGYKKNDVISVSSENNFLYFVPVVAALYLGIIIGPLNQTYTKRELLHLTDIMLPKVVFCSKNVVNSFIDLKKDVKSIERLIVLDSAEKITGVDTLQDFLKEFCEDDFSVENFEPVAVNTFEHVGAIMCSSGTTGMPKGVMVTHDNIAMRVNQMADHRLSDPRKHTVAAFLPFFHAYGFMTATTGMLKLDTFVVMERFHEELFLENIERYKIDYISIVPPIALFLAKSPLPLKYDLSSINQILCGAAPLSSEIESSIVKRFRGVSSVKQGYGLTEATIAVLLMPSGVSRIGSSGKIVPDTLVYVRDLETGKALGPNQSGELCFKGRLITKGYYRNPEATKGTYSSDGWLFTGDVGYYDDDGYFFIVDRLKELIKYKAFQVPPAELEAILVAHPKIKDAGVIGKPDEEAGELATAFVVKADGAHLTEQEVKKYVAAQVSRPKHLHGGVYFIDQIPKNPSGKILRRNLREMLSKKQSKL